MKSSKIRGTYALALFAAVLIFAALQAIPANAATLISDSSVSSQIIYQNGNVCLDTSGGSLGLYAGYSGQAASRPMISEHDVNLTVCGSGCNFTTIQAALNTVPIILRHRYAINISDGYYPENIWVPPHITMDIIRGAYDDGSVEALTIRGNQGYLSNVTVNSIHVTSAVGSNTPSINYLTVNGTSPYDDENVSIAVYGSGNAVFFGMKLSSTITQYGLMAYGGAHVSFSNSTFTTSTYRGGVLVKHGAQVLTTDGGINGTFTTMAYDLQGGDVIITNDSVSAPLIVRTDRGFAVDSANKILYGVTNFGLPLVLDKLLTTQSLAVTNGTMTLGNLSNQTLINFNMERAWKLNSYLTGGSNQLNLAGQSDGKNFCITGTDPTKPTACFTESSVSSGIQTNLYEWTKLLANTTSLPCDATHAGGIYYDGSQKKHFGCNSTAWNALY